MAGPEQESLVELRTVLAQGREAADRLLARLDDNADPVEIVSLLESLALVDERREHILEQFRKEASSIRRREEERSIRQFVLRALDEIGVPQTTGFLADYLYATELVEARSRGMGALRRDEYRAWDRLRDRPRVAYIVPCLDEDGRPVARWMSRSDWPLERRLVVDGAEELWSKERVLALLNGYRTSDPRRPSLFVPLVERYARQALGQEFMPHTIRGHEALRSVETAVRTERDTLEPSVAAAQERLAASFAHLDEDQRFWGIRR
jgi:hypothetical protein